MREGWGAKLEEWSHLKPSKADMKLQVFGVCPTGFCLAVPQQFFSVFVHSFSDGNAYSVPPCVGSI